MFSRWPVTKITSTGETVHCRKTRIPCGNRLVIFGEYLSQHSKQLTTGTAFSLQEPTPNYLSHTCDKTKAEAVVLHVTMALGRRGGIAPTHSQIGTRWGE
jgi:hypothetical protein